MVIAEYQAGGRGRGQKKWISRVAQDITVSFLYWFDLAFNYELLPLITAVAINRMFKDFKLITKIKWPNDVMLADGTKIGGILIESGINNNMRFVVIGIGIDNNHAIERNLLLVELIRNIDNVIIQYQTFGFELLQREWLDNCIHYQKMVKIIKNGEVIQAGLNAGISSNGALQVQNDQGVVHEYLSNNISLLW